MRPSHFLKHNLSQASPQHVVVVDTETLPLPHVDESETHHLEFGWLGYTRQKKDHTWTRTRWARFDSREAFYNILIALMTKKRRLTLISHNTGFDATVMGAFEELPARGFPLVKAIIEQPPVCLDWRGETGSIRWLDTLNWYQMSLAELGTYVGLPKLRMPATWENINLADTYCRRDCDIVLLAYKSWLAMVREHDLGVVAMSLAGQAFNAYRHRFMTTPIFIDADARALKLARQSYYGGRVECSRIGHYQGAFHMLDVNSMYPAVMKESIYPTHLEGFTARLTIQDLEQLMTRYAVVADVTLTTPEPAYPVRHEGRLMFPIGTFRSALTTPELRPALRQNHVQKVHACAIYKAAPIFQDFVNYFYTMRLRATIEHNEVLRLQLKLLMNSLYGKFGQVGRVYETVMQCEDTDYRVYIAIDGETGEHTRVRRIANLEQHLRRDGESNDSHPAIAAHVTAYARQVLWGAIQLAGPEHVLYCDTDSVIVDTVGYENMLPYCDDNRLGAWKLERSGDEVIIEGLKRYYFSGHYTHQGVRKDALWLAPNTIRQTHWASLKGMLRLGSLDAPVTYPVTKKFTTDYAKGTVLPSGQVAPFRFGS